MPTPPSIDINITIIILIVMPIVVICIAIILIINIGIIRYLSEVKLRLLVPTRFAHAPARRERAKQHTGLNCAHLLGHYTLRHAALTRGKRALGCKEPRDTRQRHRRNACGTATLESTGQLHAWQAACRSQRTEGRRKRQPPNGRSLNDQATRQGINGGTTDAHAATRV
eukprot:UN4625